MALLNDVQYNSDWLGCSCFHGRTISLIHSIRKRLVGGWVGRQGADDTGGGGGEDESQI